MLKENNQGICNAQFNIDIIKDIDTDDSPDADTAAYDEKIAEEKLQISKDNRTLRKEYANKVFYFICSWSIALFIILLFDGFGEINFNIFHSLLKLQFNFHLSDNVIITLLATSFIEVLGLFYIVMSYLFAKEWPSQKK